MPGSSVVSPDPRMGPEKIRASLGLPGDYSTLASIGLGEGLPIWERMATIIRHRRLDVRQLMAGFDYRSCGLIDLLTFQRALCNAFGPQWTELAMTSAEFNQVVEPYITRKPMRDGEPGALVMWVQYASDLQQLADERRPGKDLLDRLAFIEAKEKASAALVDEYGVTEWELKSAFQYFKDTIELMSKYGLTHGFRRIDTDHKGSLSSAEIKAFFTMNAACPDFVNDRTINVLVDWADLNGDDEIDYAELSNVLLCDDLMALAALVPDKKKVSQEKQADERIIAVGADEAAIAKAKKRGVKAKDVRKAHVAIHEKLWARNKTIQAVMSFLDSDGSGTITRDELVTICRKFHLMKYMDKMTKSMKGELTVDEVTTILDLVDKIGRDMGEEGIDGNRVDVQAFTKALFSYDRFANVIDILEIAKV